MPYYAWRGVNIFGDYQKGKMYARSPEFLDAHLFKREIALLKFRPISWRFQYRTISPILTIELFNQMATLLDGGVALPESLLITAEQLHHPGMQEIIHDLADVVDHGNSLSAALYKYPHLFDSITIQLIKAGEESGSLAHAMDSVAQRLQMRQEFSRAIRSALMLPAVTFVFFIAITLFLFAFVVPRFAELFLSMQQELPLATQLMLSISSFITSWRAPFLLGAVGIAGYATYLVGRSKRGKQWKDGMVLYLPIINTIIRTRFIAYFLASLALLLERGMQLVPSLQVMAHSIDNIYLKKYVTAIAREVQNGHSLSGALQEIYPRWFPLELSALVHVGENSGSLEILLKKSAVRYQDQVKQQLSRVSNLVQPLMMIVLGLLVLTLIFAIYLPIINISNVV